VLFTMLLLPAVGLLLPDTRPRRVTAAVPATALLASAALVAAGLAVDSPDAAHPAPTHLAYVLNADTGKASWVSAEPSPSEWTSQHVDSQNTDALPPGYQRGTVWTGPAPAIEATGPAVTAVRKTGTSVTFTVRSTRGAPSVTLRLNTPITKATARIAGQPPASIRVTGTRKNTWPAEIRLEDLPAEGATITVETTSKDPRVTAIDETQGLPATTPRPDTTTPSTREDGDVTAVARTYTL
ncbi:MAG: aminopeptidase, partial [Actinomycetota bacterium]|nr:aminopeptidase [Actinomycetota bacterium]